MCNVCRMRVSQSECSGWLGMRACVGSSSFAVLVFISFESCDIDGATLSLSVKVHIAFGI